MLYHAAVILTYPAMLERALTPCALRGPAGSRPCGVGGTGEEVALLNMTHLLLGGSWIFRGQSIRCRAAKSCEASPSPSVRGYLYARGYLYICVCVLTYMCGSMSTPTCRRYPQISAGELAKHC